jgi:hypothetical protein
MTRVFVGKRDVTGLGQDAHVLSFYDSLTAVYTNETNESCKNVEVAASESNVPPVLQVPAHLVAESRLYA